MKNVIENEIKTLTERYPCLSQCADSIAFLAEKLIKCFRDGGKLVVCGNGGSAADALHIAGELLKGFRKKRPLDAAEKEILCASGEDGERLARGLQSPLPVVSLHGETAFSTAWCNDADPALVYAQQAYALCREGDVFLGISTSGNAENVRLAAVAAKARGAFVAALTGKGGGKLAGVCDVLAAVPETETYKVQELHLPVYHALCLCVENGLFEE